MDKKRILVVDDDSGALEIVHNVLTTHGYEFILCPDTSQALAMVKSGASLDLAIIDLIMPDMNGLELHNRIKQLLPELPCIVVTGYSSVESYLSAMNSGAFGYLNKPYRSDDLKTLVAAALEYSAMKKSQGPGRWYELGVAQ